MGEMRPRWAKLPLAERDRRLAQSAADRARAGGPGASPVVPELERRRRQSQSDAARAMPRRWAGLPLEEQQRRRSQSDAARAKARNSGPQRAGMPSDGFDPATDETLQAMWNTIDDGGYDFMSKDDW
ncbi:hypothetical protein [Micromonospora sp. NPDC051141]|uniref:hypothetical protein n=1 Tax=Micromonospora sp. NPDC051141 TaxID=3364284 RepID=UPI00378FD456